MPDHCASTCRIMPRSPEPERDNFSGQKASPSTSIAVLGLAILISLNGCTTSQFTQTAGQLGALTKAAAEQQEKRLNSVAADERDRYRQSLAQRKAVLRVSDCAATLADAAPDPEATPGKPLPRCRLVERVSPGNFEELAPEVSFDNIAALNGALVSYADGLVLLASDSSKDQQAFTGAVTKLTASLGGLNGAIRKIEGENASDPTPKFNAIGTLVAKLGNLYFAARRQAVLKEIIIEGDPLVQRTAAILGDADSQLDLYDRLPLYQAVIAAQTRADEAQANGDVAAIRSAQDKLFAAVERFNAYRVDRARYAAIANAHAKLVEAARSGATIEDLRLAVVAILDLASTISETRKAFEPEDK